MKALIAIACLGLLAASPVPSEDQATILEVIALEKQVNDALIHSDSAKLAALMADDLSSIDSDGVLSGKSEQVNELRSGNLKLVSIDASEFRVRGLGNLAIVTGKLVEKGTYKNADASGAYRFTDVWAKRNGTWLWIAGQETLVANAK
jgi:ketosteroid isomerase-like protein